jgi:hypothetical protein
LTRASTRARQSASCALLSQGYASAMVDVPLLA